MAKKRSVKKAAKRSAKKSTKKAVKTSARSRKGQGGPPVQIKYRCTQNQCRATRKFTHMSPGDTVKLIAVNVEATIFFTIPPVSPFVSGTNPIVVAKGTTDTEVVANNAAGTFEYALTCRNPTCPTSVGNPQMIVP